MEITFEQFKYMYERFIFHMKNAIQKEDNRAYEKFGYMYCDLCNNYPEYVNRVIETKKA